MANKLQVGVLALSTAAGIYVYNQPPPVGDQAAAPIAGGPHESSPGEEASSGATAAPSPVPLAQESAPSWPGAPPVRLVPLEGSDSTLRQDVVGSSASEAEAAASQPARRSSEIADVEPRLPGGREIVRVYYGTNRKADRKIDPEKTPADYYGADLGPLGFGVVEVSVPRSHKRGHLETRRWYLLERDDATKHFVLQRIVPTGESKFLRELNGDIHADPDREAFVFVHGFGTSFEAAAWRAGQLKADLEFDGPAVLYSWPSRGRIDPYSYFRDRDSVRDSRDELAVFLETIGTQTGANKIHIIAHSMGNYLLSPVLAQLRAKPYLKSPLFDQIVLAAPDINADVFIDDIAPRLDKCGARTTIYAADNDYALRASQLFNGNKRLGTILGLKNAPKLPFVEVVDTAGAEFRLFEVGHSDYGGPVLRDLKLTLAGRQPAERGLSPHHLVAAHWELPKVEQPAAVPTAPGGIVQVNHAEVIPSRSQSKAAPAKSSTLWTSLFSWWPW